MKARPTTASLFRRKRRQTSRLNGCGSVTSPIPASMSPVSAKTKASVRRLGRRRVVGQASAPLVRERTRGSNHAYERSTSKLITANTSTTTSVNPRSTGESRSVTASAISDPRPGQENTVSVRTADADHGAEVDADQRDHREHRVAQAVPRSRPHVRSGLSRARCACSRRRGPRASTRGSCAAASAVETHASVTAGSTR